MQCGALKEEVSRAQTSLEQLQHQHKSALDELAQCKERATGMQKLLEQKEKDNEVSVASQCWPVITQPLIVEHLPQDDQSIRRGAVKGLILHTPIAVSL